MDKSKVYFVGAGPGDLELITLRGYALLQKADCVIYDGLVYPLLLECCRRKPELICVRKRTGAHSYRQDQINQLIVQKAQEYACVVRLKGGDPGMFGRAAEEIEACVRAGIDFEIVPGVTAATAAAEYCGFFLTDRAASSQVVFVTGREAPEKEDSSIDWGLLGRFDGTIVFYMAMGNLESIARTLIENGKDPYTPTAVIENATLPTQRQAEAELSAIAGRCAEAGLSAPAIVVIGPTARIRPETQWFAHKPLFGTHVLITRDEEGNHLFSHKLYEQGAQVSFLDTIQTVSLIEQPSVAEALSQMSAYDWVVFTSSKGVRHTFKKLRHMGSDARLFGDVKIACIGRQTHGALLMHGLQSDLVPEKYTGSCLARTLIERDNLSGKKMLLLRSAAAPDYLPAAFRQAGAEVTDVSVYTVVAKQAAPETIAEIRKALDKGRIDWIPFTSSSTVRSFFEQIDPQLVRLSRARIVSIGPMTTEALSQLGMKADLEAAEHTIDGILDALILQNHD